MTESFETMPIVSAKKGYLAIFITVALLSLGASLYYFSDNEDGSLTGWIFFLLSITSTFITATLLPKGENKPVEWKEWAILSAILVLALSLRLYRIFTTPYGIWSDEAANILVSLKILGGGYYPVFVPDLSQLPAFEFYYFIPFILLFGKVAASVRIAAVLIGTAAVFTTWLFTREYFGTKAALISAFILAVMRWHITLSRLGMAQIFTTLFIPLTLYFFLRSLKYRTWRDAIFAGLCAGAGLHTYYALISVPLLCGLLWLMAFLKEKGDLRLLKTIFAFLIVTAGLYAPIAEYAFFHWEHFSTRFANAASSSPVTIAKIFLTPSEENKAAREEFLDVAIQHFTMFYKAGDANGRHNLPGEPMLDKITRVLFLGGVVIAIAQLWKVEYASLLLWFLMAISGGIFSLAFEAPQAGRTIGLTGAISILSALPCITFISWEQTIKSKAFKGLLYIIVLGNLLGILWHNGHTYISRQLDDYGIWTFYSTSETWIGERLKETKGESTIYVPDALLGGPTIDLIAGEYKKALTSFHRSQDLPFNDTGKDVWLFFSPEDRDLMSYIKDLYPEAQFDSLRHPRSGSEDGILLNSAHILPASIRSMTGWSLSAEGSPVVRVPEPKFSWRSSSPLRIKGALKIETFGDYRFKVEGAGNSTITIDERSHDLVNGEAVIKLAQGMHIAEIIFTPATEEGTGGFLWYLDKTQPVEPSALAKMMFNEKTYEGGLLGQYYKGLDITGEPSILKIDPQIAIYFHITPFTRPFSIVWSGEILIPEDGSYELGTKSIDDSILEIDGKMILKNQKSLTYISNELPLEKGWHKIKVTYQSTSDYGQVYLYMRRSGDNSEIQPVPARSLRP